jgi:ABC-type nitrate/sulfonate/bicarbonate transport system substrate-binding protein
MAFDAMRADGYTLKTLEFADTAETVLALARGDLDFAVISDVTAWAAIEKGAPIVGVLDDSVNPTVLATAKDDIKHCADLQGKRIAVPNLSSGKAFMLNRYIATRCPGTTPTLLVVAGESTRVAALLAGELDLAVMDLDGLERVNETRQDKLSAPVVFAKEFPGMTTLTLFTRRDLAEHYPEAVKDYLRELLQARRRIQDPHVLSGELVSRLGMALALADSNSARYLARNLWDVNGRFTPERVQQNVDFAIAGASLRPGVKAGDVADLTFLNAVLDAIGRK